MPWAGIFSPFGAINISFKFVFAKMDIDNWHRDNAAQLIDQQ